MVREVLLGAGPPPPSPPPPELENSRFSVRKMALQPIHWIFQHFSDDAEKFGEVYYISGLYRRRMEIDIDVDLSRICVGRFQEAGTSLAAYTRPKVH